MRIIILNYEFPPLGGGAGKMAQLQAKILAKKHEVVVITTGYQDLPAYQKTDGYEIYRLNSSRRHLHKSNVFEMLSWLKHAKDFCNNYLASNTIHLAIAHFTLPGGELALSLYKKFKIPYVVVSHGHDIPWFFPRQMWYYHLATYFKIRKICRNASNILVLSEYLKQNATRFIGNAYQKKIIILPNATNEIDFPLIRNRDMSQLRILFIGRLVSQKNPLLLIEALRLLNKSGISFSCNIIGDGPLFADLVKKIEKYGLQNQIHLSGWKEKNEIIEGLKNANLFILPSRIEAMSVAILEALFSGLFIITSKEADSYKSVSNCTGTYFLNNNVEDLSEKIKEFFEKFIQSEKAFPEKSYQEIRDKFGMVNFEKNLESILKNK